MAPTAMLACRRLSIPELERRAPGAASDEPTARAAVFDRLVEAVYG